MHNFRLVCLKYFIFFIMFSVFAAIPAQGLCAEDHGHFSKKFPPGTPELRVATGIMPIQFIIDRVGGEYVDTLSLLPPGADPHTYEPKISQLAVLNDADLYFNIDSPFEINWLPRFTAVNNHMKVVDLTEFVFSPEALDSSSAQYGANTKDLDHHSSSSEHPANASSIVEYKHIHGENDPHIWLSPKLIAKMAELICAELSSLMPENKLYFENNLRAFQAQLEELDESIKKRADALPDTKKVFLVFHPSWGYFADDYGLTQIAVEDEGKEPTPATLAKILDKASNDNVSAVFVQKEFNPELAKTVASHFKKGKVVVLDPLGYNVLSSIRDAASAIVGSVPEPSAEVSDNSNNSDNSLPPNNQDDYP